MVLAARDGGITAAANTLLALMGIEHPSPEQNAGAHLAAHGLHDLHIIAVALTKES